MTEYPEHYFWNIVLYIFIIILATYLLITVIESKNKCELNPEAEGCICDEYSIYKCDNFEKIMCDPSNFTCWEYNQNQQHEHDECMQGMFKEYNKPFISKCIKSYPTPKPVKINLAKEKCVEHIEYDPVGYKGYKCGGINLMCNKGSDAACKSYDQYCCTKKRTKNECEKDNLQWIEECAEYKQECFNYNVSILVASITFQGTETPIYQIKEKVKCQDTTECLSKTCRKKTVQDMTCAELVDWKTIGYKGDCGKGIFKFICIKSEQDFTDELKRRCLKDK